MSSYSIQAGNFKDYVYSRENIKSRTSIWSAPELFFIRQLMSKLIFNAQKYVANFSSSSKNKRGTFDKKFSKAEKLRLHCCGTDKTNC